MMKRACTYLCMMLAATFTSGCGTVCNLASGDPVMYGGLGKEGEILGCVTPGEIGPSGGGGGKKAFLFYLAVIGAVVGLELSEVGLTLAGDTVTLPITYCTQRINHPFDFEPETPEPSPRPFGEPVPDLPMGERLPTLGVSEAAVQQVIDRMQPPQKADTSVVPHLDNGGEPQSCVPAVTPKPN